MKKLFVIFAALTLVGAFAATTLAADWGFYGSSRIMTWYEGYSEDLSGTGESESTVQWKQQGNSRIGANVKVNDALSGRFEYGDGPNLRILWGEYNFGGWSLGLGQNYTPVSWWVGAQAYGQDNGLIGYGAPYGSRKDQIKMRAGGFQLALIENTNNGGYETMLPKIEARYDFGFSNFKMGVFGGYQSYKDTAADESVSSMMYGLGFNGNFGAFWFNSAFQGGTNMAEAGWYGTYDGNMMAPGGEDTQTMGIALALGMSASEVMSFEGGLGYTAESNDDLGDETDTTMALYVNMTYTIAPGFFVVPEIGYVDNMKNMADADEGTLTYAGAKWQINF